MFERDKNTPCGEDNVAKAGRCGACEGGVGITGSGEDTRSIGWKRVLVNRVHTWFRLQGVFTTEGKEYDG